jgi:hypothetical protein
MPGERTQAPLRRLSVPDTRQHRGAHPEDRRLFAPAQLPALQAAIAELSWLLTRGYPPKAALKLVGDRHALTERQRLAVSRAACSDPQREGRSARRVAAAEARGADLRVDGFNLLITVEAALSGGLLLRCRDGCLRDLASIHGSYRSVQETTPAVERIGTVLADLAPRSVHWLLDRPVSNSGRLAQRLRDLAALHSWPWTVEPVFNPDADLVAAAGIVVSSDSLVLDGAARWLDLASLVVETLPERWEVNLSRDE